MFSLLVWLMRKLFIEQGFEIKRPSSLYVIIDQKNDEIESIRVGGDSVTVAEGHVFI